MFIRSASGLRGIAKEDFSSAIIDQYISSYIQNQNIHKCAIGRDGREVWSQNFGMGYRFFS
jgi:phosphomannomutase